MTISEEKITSQKKIEKLKNIVKECEQKLRKRLEMKEKENLKIQNYLLCMI